MFRLFASIFDRYTSTECPLVDINPTTATVNYLHSNLLSARPGGHCRVVSLPFALRRGGPQSYAPASVQTKLASKLHSPNVNYGFDPTRALINEPTGTSALSSPYMCRRLIYNLLFKPDILTCYEQRCRTHQPHHCQDQHSYGVIVACLSLRFNTTAALKRSGDEPVSCFCRKGNFSHASELLRACNTNPALWISPSVRDGFQRLCGFCTAQVTLAINGTSGNSARRFFVWPRE
jgi:hypothetical protein